MNDLTVLVTDALAMINTADDVQALEQARVDETISLLPLMQSPAAVHDDVFVTQQQHRATYQSLSPLMALALEPLESDESMQGLFQSIFYIHPK